MNSRTLTNATHEPAIHSSAIPVELLALPQWIAWWCVAGEGRRVRLPNGRETDVLKVQTKPHKLPINPQTGGLASSTRSATWSTSTVALAAVQRWSLTGIGFVFTDLDPYSGVDIDNCRDPNAGRIVDWAWTFIQSLNSYTEVSPSGTGVHIIIRGKLPTGKGNQATVNNGKVEMFSRVRYFTFTGLHVDGTPTSIIGRQAELLALHNQLFPDRHALTAEVHQTSPSVQASDEDLIARARRAHNGPKFERLWNGQWQGDYPSASEADLALCCLLAFWTRKDQTRIDALFRRSGMMRNKWLRKAYREETMSKAIDMTSEVWNPDARSNGSLHNGGPVKASKSDLSPAEWPRSMEPEAFHGLAGDLVNTILPHTEADPAALLIQLLVAFGNVVGRCPYYAAGTDRHYPNEFAVLVGATSKGRKGSSWSAIEYLLEMADSEWVDTRIQSGLSSGEGLIWAVRDEIKTKEPIRAGRDRRVTGYQEVVKDHGISDKRLLVVESEFASPLRVAEREGNTLSAVVRQAWDTGRLRVLNKNSPAKATGAHISMIGHVTKAELLKYLTNVEAANGFANRFLWVAVKRSKFLPDGGSLQTVDLGSLIGRLCRAIQFARTAEEIKRDLDAKDLWHDVYPRLSGDKPGLFGVVTSRAEAHMLRLSSLYALLDCSTEVRLPHLAAALELWRYCEDSCRFIFGDALGDPTADTIRAALKRSPAGLTRTEISKLFDRHKSATEVTRALDLLQSLDMARFCTVPTKGRPVERWVAM